MAIQCPKCHAENPDTKQFCGDCGTQLPSIKDMGVTKTIETPAEVYPRGSIFADRYKIIEKLGIGGMGTVYKAEDTKIGQDIALKLIKPDIASDKKTIERFRNELKTTRMISHRNVCRMFDLGDAEGTYFITMEYVPGEDLKSLIRRVKQIPEGTAISIAKQVCEGLAEAHRLGVVHRDLKSSNIMIDKEGNARIMDFGIARSLEAKGITGEGVVIGTPEYMSPEQIEGSEVDKRSDIYSLGVILYEMVTGRVPFVGETALSIAMKHKSKSPQHPKEHNAQIPDDLSYLILRCLEKDKEKRYQSAAAVLSDLENIEKGVPTTDIVPPKKKHITSKEITVTFRLRKMLIPALTLAAAVIIGVIIWQVLFQKDGVSIPSEKRSIAVLPFEDLSPQKDQEYFCDGLADELINRLSNLENLRILARTTAFSFKDKGLGIQEIAKRLEVENVLEGSIRKAGNKIRITVQLVNAADGYPFWSEKYERDEQDIFALQDEISLAIVDKINLRLLGRDKAILIKRYTENLEAYNLYLEGRFFWNKRTEEAMIRAIKYFEQAIEKDSNYALAYVGIADAYNMLGRFNMLPPTEAYSKAKMSATKALAIDDKLAEAYTSSGWVKHFFDLDWSGADAAFKNAIRLNGNYATAHQWYGGTLLSKGRTEEAFKEIERALELDPLSLPIITSIGMIHYIARQFDQAIIHCKKALEIESTFPWAHSVLASSYLQNSLFEEAIAEFQKAVTLSESGTQYLAELAHAYAVAGNRDKAVQILKELLDLSQQKYVPGIGIALVYAGLAEKDKALQWLENAIENEERSFDLVFLKVEPKWDSLCSDSRFKALLNKVNLE